MITLTLASQIITIPLIIDFLRFIGFWLLIPLIIVEPFILERFSKKSLWKLFKFCVIINFISALAGILLSFFACYLNAIPLYWLALIIIIIWIENIIYQKHWKVARKKKLLLTLIIINLITYTISTVPFGFIYSRHAEYEYMKRLRCTNNLKLIGITLMMYADDYKGFLPDKPGIKGFEQLRNYFSGHDAFRCLSCPLTIKQDNQKFIEKNVGYIYLNSLRLNPKDSKTPLVWDKPSNHENYGNVLFLDGHVKGFKGKDWMEQAGIKKKADK